MLRRAITCIAVLTAASAIAANAAGSVVVKDLKLLIPIYRGGPSDAGRLSDDDVAAVRAGIDLGRLFYFRNTRGKLNLSLEYLVIPATAPNNDDASYDAILADLQARGVGDDEYDGLYTTGIGLTGNWGGYQFLGHTAGAMGMADRGGLFDWWPGDDPGVWYAVTWTFCHEFQHALDGVICEGSGRPDMLSDHPYADSAERWFWWGHQAGQHFDWVAHTLRSFTGYENLRGVTDSRIEATDSDGDGLADSAPELPMDEARLGSDPAKADTDGDGLSDLGEFAADIYRGSDPTKTDTDGDGLDDGKDPHPTVAMASGVAYAAAELAVDGVRDAAYQPLTLGVYATDGAAANAVRTHACWNEDGLYLFATPAGAGLQLSVDSSMANGFWEGGDTYLVRVGTDGRVVFSGLGLDGPVPGAKAVAGADGLEVHIPAVIGQGVSGEINFGGARRPADVADGLVLERGGIVGLNVEASVGGARALLTPKFTLMAVALEKGDGEPSRPSLRFAPATVSDPLPSLPVTGVQPGVAVTVVDGQGRAIGRRLGSGPVQLALPLTAGHTAEAGQNTLTAVTADGARSPERVVVCDTGAAAPSFADKVLRGEPGAVVDVFGGQDGLPMVPLASVRLGADGTGPFDPASVSRGFLGAYGRQMDFDHPAFARVDGRIDFDYQDRAADPRLPPEYFCIRWTGTLDVPADGEYGFYLTSDDGSRLYIDGEPLIDHWGHHGMEERSNRIRLSAGAHAIRLDYYEEDGWAGARLEWSGPGFARTADLPVAPVPPGLLGQLLIRQTDAAGNRSVFAECGG